MLHGNPFCRLKGKSIGAFPNASMKCLLEAEQVVWSIRLFRCCVTEVSDCWWMPFVDRTRRGYPHPSTIHSSSRSAWRECLLTLLVICLAYVILLQYWWPACQQWNLPNHGKNKRATTTRFGKTERDMLWWNWIFLLPLRPLIISRHLITILYGANYDYSQVSRLLRLRRSSQWMTSGNLFFYNSQNCPSNGRIIP